MRALAIAITALAFAGCKHNPRGKDPSPVPVPEFRAGTHVSTLAARSNTSCVHDARGVVCWGIIGEDAHKATTPVGLGRAQEVAVDWRVCGLDGTHVQCTKSPESLDATLPAHAHALGISRASACALADGKVLCWGHGETGMLGNPTANQAEPTAVAGLDGVVSLSVGSDNACAVDGSGKVWCWGAAGWSGKLAPGVTCTKSYMPEQHLPPGAVGEEASALRFVGEAAPIVYCDQPVAVAGVTDAIAVAVGQEGGGCVITRAKTVRCWGENLVDVPGLTGAAQVVVGSDFRCARLDGGGVQCWGANDFGQLGNGTTTQSDTPVAVLGVEHAVGLAAGIQHACALSDGGGVRCWGQGLSGQLGDGEALNRLTPVEVKW